MGSKPGSDRRSIENSETNFTKLTAFWRAQKPKMSAAKNRVWHRHGQVAEWFKALVLKYKMRPGPTD